MSDGPVLWTSICSHLILEPRPTLVPWVSSTADKAMSTGFKKSELRNNIQTIINKNIINAFMVNLLILTRLLTSYLSI